MPRVATAQVAESRLLPILTHDYAPFLSVQARRGVLRPAAMTPPPRDPGIPASRTESPRILTMVGAFFRQISPSFQPASRAIPPKVAEISLADARFRYPR
ncbi:MAG: hypothetical protein DWQ31_20570 [Planctomycetota bacterium]|nr:MAG: hypothetical protein DWQ31_20570 [Planctomycetota bacterium]REJ96683.1 MAG: hypothetical protein DWQ35_03695 [Planctomycetota bacterium]